MTNSNNTRKLTKPTVPFELATGSPKYGLTNDYMFRVVFQENELARKGLILNIKNHRLYSDKFSLYVVDLTHIELATEEDIAWKIDHWARLFTATTWEEVKMITENDIHMKEAARELYVLSADEMIEERCRARNDYQKQINTHNRTLLELEETQKALDAKNIELNNALKEIERLNQLLTTQTSQNQ